METSFDIIVVGSGPAGYVAAIRAAQMGFRTACVEKEKKGDSVTLGGTCLNVGCIPSKALLEASHHYADVINGRYADTGIAIGDVAIDVEKLIHFKDGVVSKLTSGIQGLFQHNKITTIVGTGRVTGTNEVTVGDTAYQAKYIIIATGSVPMEIPPARFDHKYILDSTDALSMTSTPNRLGVIGAGVIGLELGSVWSRFGSKVTVFEAMDNFLATADGQLAKELKKLLEVHEGLDIRLSTKVIGTSVERNEIKLSYEDKEGKVHHEVFDKVIVAVGRKPNTAGVIDPSVGVVVNERGFIQVDNYCQTDVPNIYAIGDIVRGPMLAHKGSEEGVMVVERIAGEKAEVNYDTIPNVVYTEPEFAWVGKTEEQLQAEGIPYKKGVFPFKASGRALANHNAKGMTKLLRHAETDRILGAHILCRNAGELLAQMVLVMEFQGSAEDVILTMYAHPTISEAVHEAALASHGRAIHIPNR